MRSERFSVVGWTDRVSGRVAYYQVELIEAGDDRNEDLEIS